MLKNNKIIIFLLTIVCFSIYFNSLSNDFIWDDLDLVKNNPCIKDWRNIGKIFTADLFYKSWEPSNFYRPLQTLSYMIDYSVWKLNPLGYHLTNILLHFLCGVLVYFLALFILDSRSYASISSLFFIVHPVHTEAVTYISGRADSLATLFFILTIILFLRSNSDFSIRWRKFFYAASILSFIFGLLSKEMMVVLPLLLLLSSVLVKNKKALVIQSIPFFMLGIVYICLRLTILNFGTPEVLANRIPIGLRLLTTAKVIFMYMGIMLFPFNLHMDRSIVPATSLFEFDILISVVFLSVILLMVIKSYKYSKALFFSSVWFFINLLPVSNIFPLNAFIAEHWLYLPSIGLFSILALGLKKLVEIVSIKQIRQCIFFLFFFVLFFYAMLTIQQNKIWNNPVTFYQYTLKFVPHNSRLHNNLGNVYFEKGMYEEARKEFEKSLEINPNSGKAHFNLGNLFHALGKLNEAIDEYKKAIAIEKNNAAAHHNLGNLYFKNAEYTKAIEEFEVALTLEPDNIDLLVTLGDAYREMENFDKAIDIYNEVLKINPKLVNAYINLGVTHTLKGEFEKAIRVYTIAAELAPDLAVIHVNLGSAYANIGNFEQARAEWKRALELDPNYEKAKQYLDKLKTFRAPPHFY